MKTDWHAGQKLVDSTFAPVLGGDKKGQSVPLSAMASSWAALAASTEALAWLTARGITLKTAQQLHFGFAHDKGAVVVPTVADGVITNIKYFRFVKTPSCPSCACTLVCSISKIVSLARIFSSRPTELQAALLVQAGYRAVAYPSAKYNPLAQQNVTV